MSPRIAPWVAAAVLPVCLAAGPALAAEVVTEHDGQADFSKYRSYSWKQKPDTGKSDTDARIVETIDSQLQARGWSRVEEGPSDTVLAAHAIIREDQQIDTAYSGWGSGWNWSGPGPLAGVATTVRTQQRIGSLVVDIFDAATKKLVWRGTAKDTLAPDVETNRRKLQQAVTRLFKGFPPSPSPERKDGR